ncbi:Fpg/Nei family DNA glycosylase [Phycisphaera mikurensis]|uniref:DNA-(apurinic or apyrimidinic site) lyase n=1 Tax=Phycisphaera mikurensis (strain NBRC 102666 / KCTC 22515 / FYK2301M01) TaxID=1142394 RepID=I0ICZ6_PHYMF|nr:DNA glycosylase/DNA-(apurinic or apyrimidinic site) lyase [Phycisphaera mikurensis]MBB6442264.1 endonuclease-8 [Phycisphaera mikurensis]BAM03134.1 putative DNA glycosylase/DNA-(apurinic or apyrimidinic site) lyase [Phycisphaera mikurensis NBRC 102666]
MEGPGIRFFAENLQRVIGQRLEAVEGERAGAVEPERFVGRTLAEVVPAGKLLFFRFRSVDDVVIRVHCLMFGDVRINEDRPGKTLTLRLGFERDRVDVYLGAARAATAGEMDDGRVPVTRDMLDPRFRPARGWDAAAKALPDAILGDALLDQDLFPGLGNKIKNEAMFRARVSPLDAVGAIPRASGLRLMREAAAFSRHFLGEYRAGRHIQPSMQLYGRRTCPACGGPVSKQEIGELQRKSHWCPACQPRKA